MKKLSLTLDQLEVDTFVAGPAAPSVGTVKAHDVLDPYPQQDGAVPAPSYDTMCERTLCFTCDRSCPSNVTACYTGSAPNCCT
jgi:hypothetical protein